MIADANGLDVDGDGALVQGQTLEIPAQNNKGFSFGQLATAAVTGGIAAGISEAAGVGTGAEAGTLTEISQETGKLVLSAGGRAVVGAASALGAAATNKLIGGASGFSWANVAASAVSSAVGSPLPGENNNQGFITNVGNSILGSAAAYGTRKLVNNEGSWNTVNIATDAFGNALGNSIVQAGQSKPQSAKNGSAEPSTQVGRDAYDAAIASGQSGPEAAATAIKALAESSGGAVDLTEVTNADGIKTQTGINGLDITKNVQVSNGENTGQFYVGGVRTQEDANNLLGHVSNFLDQGSLPGNLRDVSFALASRSIRGVSERQDAFYEGVARGINNVRNSAELARVRQNIVDLNDPATRASFLKGQFIKDNAKLQKQALQIVAIAASPALVSVTATLFGTKVAGGAVIGSAANVSATGLTGYLSGNSASFDDYFQAGVTGYLGGGIGGKIGGKFGAGVGSFSGEFFNQAINNDGIDYTRLGLSAGFGALGQGGSNLISQRFGTKLSQYLPNNVSGLLSGNGLTPFADDFLLGTQQATIGTIGNVVVEGTEVLINSTPERIHAQYEQRQQFIEANRQLQKSSPFGDSYLDRVYKTRVGLRGDR